MEADQLPELDEKIANRREEAGVFRGVDLGSSSNLYCRSQGEDCSDGEQHDRDALHGGQRAAEKNLVFPPQMSPHAERVVSRGWLLCLARALLLVVCLRLPVPVRGQQQGEGITGPLPGGGRFTALPDLPIQYIAHNSIIIVRNATLVVDPIAKSSFDYYGTYTLNTKPAVDQFVHFSGSAVCVDGAATRILFTVDADSCSSSQSISWFCQSAPTLYSGTFDYGLSLDSNGYVQFIIGQSNYVSNPGWGGAQWSFRFLCSSTDGPGACTLSSSCNFSVSIRTDIFVTGGTVNASNSNIYPTDTTINLFGDQINVNQGNNLTVVLANETTIAEFNFEGDENTVNINEAPEQVTLLTSSASTCATRASWGSARPGNTTLNTLTPVKIVTTSGSLTSPDGSWSLPDASTLRFDGDDEDAVNKGYLFVFTLQGADLYNGIQAGQRVIFFLWNVTAGSPFDSDNFATTAEIYNHTNPAFVGGATTSMLLFDIHNGNEFSIFALLEHTDASGGGAILSDSSYSLNIIPAGCQGNVNNFNWTVNFNDSTLCSDIDPEDPDHCKKVFNETDCAECIDNGDGTKTFKVKSNFTEFEGEVEAKKSVKVDKSIEVVEVCHCGEVRADPPVTIGSSTPYFCFPGSVACTRDFTDSCCGGGGGGGGGGSLPNPNFPIGAPLPAGVPGLSGFPSVGPDTEGATNGAGPGPGGPTTVSAPTPIATEPVGADPIPEPTGMYIPRSNFSQEVPFCGNGTRRWITMNEGEQPNVVYICMVIDAAGTFAWKPMCQCGTATNMVLFASNVTSTYSNASVVIGCTTCTFTWLGDLSAGCDEDHPLRTSFQMPCDGRTDWTNINDAQDTGFFYDSEENGGTAESFAPGRAGMRTTPTTNGGLLAYVYENYVGPARQAFIVNNDQGVLFGAEPSGGVVLAYHGVPSNTPNFTSDTVGEFAIDTLNNRWYFYSNGAWRAPPMALEDVVFDDITTLGGITSQGSIESINDIIACAGQSDGVFHTLRSCNGTPIFFHDGFTVAAGKPGVANITVDATPAGAHASNQLAVTCTAGSCVLAPPVPNLFAPYRSDFQSPRACWELVPDSPDDFVRRFYQFPTSPLPYKGNLNLLTPLKLGGTPQCGIIGDGPSIAYAVICLYADTVYAPPDISWCTDDEIFEQCIEEGFQPGWTNVKIAGRGGHRCSGAGKFAPTSELAGWCGPDYLNIATALVFQCSEGTHEADVYPESSEFYGTVSANWEFWVAF